MKKPLIIVSISLLIIAGIAVAIALPPSLQSGIRREWKQRRIAEISALVSDPAWPGNELARLKTTKTSGPGGEQNWISPHMILMRNGDWLAYANICHKEDRRIHDLFLARGSDGRWHYSTYHFCIGMLALRMERQPNDLTEFSKEYSVRTFDGQSDECLQKTWPQDVQVSP